MTKATYPACVKPEILRCPGIHVYLPETLWHDSDFDALGNEVRYEVLWGQWGSRNAVVGLAVLVSDSRVGWNLWTYILLDSQA